MRKKFCILALSTAVLLGGCGPSVPNLSEVDNDVAAQYVADALLKNDKNYDESLDYDHSILQATPTPMPTEAPTPVPENKSENESEANPSGGEGSTILDEGNDSESIADVPLSDIYGISGVSIKEKSYELKNSFGSDGYSVITAGKGKKLAVVYFTISNDTDSKKKVDFTKKKMDISLIVNEESIANPLLTIAEGDLQTFKENISPGKKKQGVLVFEVDKNLKIDNLSVSFSTDMSKSVVNVH